MKSRADLEKRCQTTMNDDPAIGGRNDAGENLQESGLAGTILANQRQALALLYFQGDPWVAPKTLRQSDALAGSVSASYQIPQPPLEGSLDVVGVPARSACSNPHIQLPYMSCLCQINQMAIRCEETTNSHDRESDCHR